jgi:hypothetical protein
MDPFPNCGLITVEEIEETLGRRQVTADEFAEAVKRRGNTGCSLGEALVQMGLISRSELAESAAQYRLSGPPTDHPKRT